MRFYKAMENWPAAGFFTGYPTTLRYLLAESISTVLVKPVAFAANLDEMRMVHQSIEERGNGLRVSEEFS
jgi:hypothetical protein